MRAVNLIDEGGRRGGAGASGAAYALLAVLAVLVLGVTYHVLTSNTIADRRVQLAALSTQAQAAQAQADQMRPYTDFASLAAARVQTVRQLGAARFDWKGAFDGLAKVIPANVWLTSLLGTVTTGVTVEGAASGATSTLRSALPNPAIELTGCTTTHDDVVRLLSRLRVMDGVVRVSLADSTKGDTSGGGGGSTSDSADCRHGHASFPQFDAVVFFDPLPAVPTAPGSANATATGAATSGTASAAGTTAPATGTTAPANGTTTASPSAQPAAATTPAATGAPSTGSAAR